MERALARVAAASSVLRVRRRRARAGPVAAVATTSAGRSPCASRRVSVSPAEDVTMAKSIDVRQ